MLKKIYPFVLKILSKPKDRGKPSAGIWQELIRKTVFDLIGNKNGKILEIGCGEGLFLKKFKNDFNRIVGIDISFEQLKKAKESHKELRLIRADASDVPFKDSVFDIVICINFFLNIPSEEKVFEILKEIKRVSTEKAKFIFEIRNQKSPLIILKYKTAKYYDNTVMYLQTFRYEDLREKLEALNFKIKKRINLGFPIGKFSPIIVIEAIKND
ncbi:MAG: methyltransferase domain-containing protein [Candidatus Omnitrophica bacterium]|nr:methyltransferase domain-containing protein [Candidatus Omnitrophota bacterium]